MKYTMYCNNRKKKYYNNNNNSSSGSSNNNNKCYIVIILYVCLLNIVINNVSLSNEDIISKQEFQKLLDIKHNVTGLKKISETMFELMFNTNDDDNNKKEVIKHTTATANDSKEVKSTTAPNDVGMKENKGLDDRTTEEIMGDGGEREKEQEEKETDNAPEETIVHKIKSVKFAELLKIYDKMIHYCCDVSSNHKETQQDVRKIFLAINELTKRFSFLDSLKSTPQEITEIVNKAISSYNEANKNNTEELNKKIDEINKQNMKESNLYHTQIIQMFKDLIENVNKLNNKVDRLESIISQKKIEEKKQEEEENYKVVKAIEVIKPVETDDSILDRAQRIIDEANAQKLLQGQLQSRQVNAEPITQSQQKLLETKQESSEREKDASTPEPLKTSRPTSQPSTPVILK